MNFVTGNDGCGESVSVSPTPAKRGPRLRYKSDVVDQLESFFQHTPFPSREDRDFLNESTDLNPDKIKVYILTIVVCVIAIVYIDVDKCCLCYGY